MLLSDKVLAFLPNVDCVLLVAAAESSAPNETYRSECDLAERTNALGVVLNKCRFSRKITDTIIRAGFDENGSTDDSPDFPEHSRSCTEESTRRV